MGEVTHAQTILLQDDKINILEALSMCGDLTKDADRSDILVMRENGQGTKEVKHINLENHSVFTSPVYFLQPNDILYVHPNDYTLKNLGRAKRQAIVTTVLTVLSIVIIVVDRIIKR